MTTLRRLAFSPPTTRSVALLASLLGAAAFAAKLPADAPERPPAVDVTPSEPAPTDAAPAADAAPASPVAPIAEPIHGAFVGDEWRYPNHNILVRWLTDIVAIPTGFVTWSPQDAATFALISGGTLALMIGETPGDVYVQRWAHETFGLRQTRFTFWYPATDVVIWSVLGATGLGLYAYGWMFDGDDYMEAISIIVEAFSVAQVFHVLPKLLIGREGPMDGNGNAIVYGPTHSISLYPAGTPSGHAASLYAVMGAISMYTDNGWLLAGMHAFGAFFCTMMLIDDYHFLSDILWGASMGYAVGQWTVRHRSKHWHDTTPGYPVRIVPMVDLKNGAAALALGFAF